MPDPSDPPAPGEGDPTTPELPSQPAAAPSRVEPLPILPSSGPPAPAPPVPVRQAPKRYEPDGDLEYGQHQAHPSRLGLSVVLAGAGLGSIFASVSTSDFMQHLDRQVHAIHCSFIPGAGKEIGESGCRAVMMSPYSSFFRESVWGGIPVSLLALAVFAFLVYRAATLWGVGKPTRAQTLFLLTATCLPLLMTAIFAYLSVSKVGSTCRVCVGIYFSSGLVFIGALLAHRSNSAGESGPAAGAYVRWFGQGVAFVAALTLTYLYFSPASDPKTALTGCGALVSGDDPGGVMIPLTSGSSGEPAIEVLDPLCPSCKAFDVRLNASHMRHRLALKAVLFPLDNTCNWMVTEAVHPGACAVSEALLCAAGLSGPKDEEAAHDVLQWAFGHQEELRELAAKDEPALRAKIEAKFPKVKDCLGTPLVKNKLTKSLRWAVSNAIPVLTPQLFVGNARLCDEDTDLGLEYTLSNMLSSKGQQARAAQTSRPKPAPSVKPPPVKEGTP